MRVLQINSVCGIGSTGRIATDLAQVLEAEGHECYIAYGRESGIPENPKHIRIGTNIDNYLHVAKTRLLDRHGFGSKRATKELVEEIKKLNPDVIHLHNLHGYYLNIEVLFNFLKEFNKRVIWTLHDCWAFTGHCSHFEYINCQKWKTGCFQCPHQKGYPSSVMVDNSRSNYHSKKSIFRGVEDLTIVTPSKWLAGLVSQSFLKDYPIEVINNGIDLNVFKPTSSSFREKHNLQDRYILLGVASVWGEGKGFNYFLELANHIQEDEVIVLVGVSEEQQKYLPANVVGIRKTHHVKELAEIYTSADVFINPTLNDNFPTTNLEALACGIPVITFHTGGSVESVIDGCGHVIEQGEIPGMLKAIADCKSIDKQKLKSAAVARARNFYNKADRFYDYIRLYEKNEGAQNKKIGSGIL